MSKAERHRAGSLMILEVMPPLLLPPAHALNPKFPMFV